VLPKEVVRRALEKIQKLDQLPSIKDLINDLQPPAS
jgi:hypothetical protein